MKKNLYIEGHTAIFLIVVILLVSPISACVVNNDFVLGENIEICTGNTTFENETISNKYHDCSDSTCNHLITIQYPNNTIIKFRQSMSFKKGNIFNYSIGNSTTDLNNITGSYQVDIDSYAGKGWKSTRFFIIISASPIVEEVVPTRAGGFTATIIKEAKEIREPIEDTLKKWWFYVGIIGVIGLFIYLDMKKRKIKNLAKEVNKIKIEPTQKRWKK